MGIILKIYLLSITIGYLHYPCQNSSTSQIKTSQSSETALKELKEIFKILQALEKQIKNIPFMSKIEKHFQKADFKYYFARISKIIELSFRDMSVIDFRFFYCRKEVGQTKSRN